MRGPVLEAAMMIPAMQPVMTAGVGMAAPIARAAAERMADPDLGAVRRPLANAAARRPEG
jgi:hypothetical protein